MNNRYSTGLDALDIGHEKYQQSRPQHQKQQHPPPDYSKKIPIGIDKKTGETAYMKIRSSDRIGIYDRTGGGKCLSKNSRIYTNTGYKEAQDVFEEYAGDLSEVDEEGEWYSVENDLKVATLTKDGSLEWTRPSRIYRQEFNQKLRRVELADGSQILITETHPLLTENGWTSDIEEGDQVAVPKYLPSPETVEVSPQLAKLLAWQVAEGCESKYRCIIEQKEREVLEELKSIFDSFDFKKETGTRGHPGQSFTSSIDVDPAIKRTNKGLYRIQLCSKQYHEYLEEEIGYEWGLRSAEKKIPEGIMRADKQAKKVFIREFLDAEGTVEKEKARIEFTSASEQLIRQLKSLLREFGIWMRISRKEIDGFDHIYWRGWVASKELRKYRDRIGFKRKSKALPESYEYNSNTDGIPCCDIISDLKENNIPVGEVRSYDDGKQPSREKIENLIIQLHRVKHYYRSQAYNNGWNFSPDIKKAVYEDLDEDWLDSKIERLQKLVDQDVWWSKIVSIEEVDYSGYIYDFCVPETHNFVAEDMMVHNTSLLKRLVAGLWFGGSKVLHLTDVKNDFNDIDREGGVGQNFIDAAGLAKGERPRSVPVRMRQPRFLYNEYRKQPPAFLRGDVKEKVFAYGFQDLSESEIKSFVNPTSQAQSEILSSAISRSEDNSFSELEEELMRMKYDAQSGRESAVEVVLDSVRSLKEQQIVDEVYRENLPFESLEDGVVAMSMDNWDNFKRRGRKKLELQLAITIRRLKQQLRDGEISGPVATIYDEAHVFCGKNNSISTPEVKDLVDLGRDYDVPMIVASQRPSQIASEITNAMSHFFIGPNVPPDQQTKLLNIAKLHEHSHYGSGKWTKVFRDMKRFEWLHVDTVESRWRVIIPFAPPCYHPFDPDA